MMLNDFVCATSEDAWWIDTSRYSSRVRCFLCDSGITVGPGVDINVVSEFVKHHSECNTLED